MLAQRFIRRVGPAPDDLRLTGRLLVFLLAAIAVTTFPASLLRRVGASTPEMQGAQVAIHDIQSDVSGSPFDGQVVTTSGVVTAIKSNGFFLQTPDAQADNDPNTSEGIFIFTSSAPPASVTVAGLMRVTGTVVEFRPSSDPGSFPLTEMHPTAIEAIGSGALPFPVTITSEDFIPARSIEQLEKFECMRVRVDSLTVAAPTGGNVNERNATSSSNGVFYGVLTGTGRPFREPGLQLPDALPPGSPCCVPRFDANPELLRVDSNGQRGTSPLEVSTGAIITGLVGVLDYAARAYTILPDANSFTVTPGMAAAFPVSAPASDEFTVASFNMERFFDTTDDPGVSDVALTQQAFNNRLSKASLAIRNVMRSPDIIGVEEVENLATLQAVADKLNADAVAAGETNPIYVASLVEGNDPGGIDVGFLVKNSRVVFFPAAQVGKNATYTNPNNGQQDTLNDRPPLVLRAALVAPGGSSLPITVIVNHLRSLSGIDDRTDGARVRAKRRAQAEFLASLIQARQADDPNERIIVVGDFNSFQFNDGYVDVIGTVKGTPTPPSEVVLASSDLVNPNFFNITDLVAPNLRYSFVFNGNAQTLDHILVSENMFSRVARVEYAHSNADFPESLRNDPSRPERISDHDMPVAYFEFQAGLADLAVSAFATPSPVPRNSALTYTITVSNAGPETATGVAIRDSFSPLGVGFGFDTIAAGESRTIRVVHFINQPVGSTVTNTISVSSNLVDPNTGNNSVTVTTAVVSAVPRIQFASINGKKLTVTGEGFEAESVIEINGKAQRTVPGEAVFFQALIAPKGGKKIVPGDTVTLTVLNPDGVRSAPFPFTRPVQ